MAYLELGMAKEIALNAPKYKRIVEPFGDVGTLAFYPGKKKPKEHIVNIEDIEKFTIMTFLQSITSSEKKALKAKDWLGTPKTFDAVISINKTEGVDFYYKYFYLKSFSEKQKDLEATPIFNYLKFGKNISSILYAIPQQKGALKNVTLLNEDPLSVLNKASGADTYLILVPKTPEHNEFIATKLSNITASYFYASKSKSNEILFENVQNLPNNTVTTLNASTIMVATMQVITNYDSRLKAIDLDKIEYKK